MILANLPKTNIPNVNNFALLEYSIMIEDGNNENFELKCCLEVPTVSS